MSDLSVFFKPVNKEELAEGHVYAENMLGNLMRIHDESSGFPELEGFDIVLIGV